MITTAILSFGIFIGQTILSLFPIGSGFPSEVDTAFAWLGGYLQMLDPLIPINTLGTTVTVVVTMELIIFGWKGFNYLLSKMPFLGK